MGITSRDVLCGTIGVLLAIAGCATAGFPYRYYGLIDADFRVGRLLGPKPEDDIPFAACTPTAVDAAPCTCLLSPTFRTLKLDYQDTGAKLAACERALQQCGRGGG